MRKGNTFHLNEWKQIKDVYELANYCSKKFGKNYSLSEVERYVCKLDKFKQQIPMYDVFYDICNSYSNILLKDEEIGGKDAYEQINTVMRTLHYSNGMPLSCDEYDYFEHYDREQERAIFYEDIYVKDFVTDGETLYIRLDMSFEELKNILQTAYDDIDYEHDFNEEEKEWI